VRLPFCQFASSEQAGFKRGDEPGVETVPAGEGEAFGERGAAAFAETLIGTGTAAGGLLRQRPPGEAEELLRA